MTYFDDRYASWRDENPGRTLPERLIDLLYEARYPRIRPINNEIGRWLDTALEQMDQNGRALVEFVETFYPPTKRHLPDKTADDLRIAQGKFWNEWAIKKAERGGAEFHKVYVRGISNRHLLVLTAFLELAHDRWKRQEGEGKSGLYRLANRMRK